jgi:8-oxo-dGTP pyrophosphatase MutT (NUDIX family)
MAERYDIFTDARVPTGETRPRYEALRNGEYRLGAEIWILNADGRIMVTKRHPQKREYPGLWECTGGFVCSGETTLDTILRETREEIGLPLSPADVRLVGTQLRERQFIDLYTATVEVRIESLVLQPEEVTDAKWVTWDELAALRARGEFVDFIFERIMRYRDSLPAQSIGD